ncbi:MAG: beta-ketoacyl-[acyl-carrier-protein] synthase family protein [Woeseiaceae bacterium]|nr:beta-ketoacyl-[acyl-carrier-protein] synthase family protein [Woeseiaceae bacterium]
MRLAIGQYTATSAVGAGLNAMRDAIRTGRSGLRRNDLEHCDLDTWIGRVQDVESVELPDSVAHLHSRNNQLAWLGLQQDGMLDSITALKERAGPERIGIVMGTSTSSIGRTEKAYRHLLPSDEMPPEYRQPLVHNLHSPGIFVQAVTGITGPSLTISTACSSSAKVFASAARWINHGLVDAVLVGGVDSLCMSILYGFNSLELVSPNPCRPFDRRRDGISIGESCGYAIVARPELIDDSDFVLLGYGESADAYHMSHPHPDGKGALLAMTQALQRAELDAGDVDYINLHGTASQANDRIESRALAQLFSENTLASSTKGWTGHTLGAAGILEAIITLEAMRYGEVPGTLNCDEPEDDFDFGVIRQNVARPIRYAMTNSFGFGGNNASLAFGAAHD